MATPAIRPSLTTAAESFRLNRLDAQNPAQVQDYLQHPHYYQTLACLRQRNLIPADRPFNPLLVKRELWQNNPQGVIENLAKQPDAVAVGTMAYLSAYYPQSEAGLRGIIAYLYDWDSKRNGYPACREFVLMDIYNQATGPEAKRVVLGNIFGDFSDAFGRHNYPELNPKDHIPLFEEYSDWLFAHKEEALDACDAESENSGFSPNRYDSTLQALAQTGKREVFDFLAGTFLNPEANWNLSATAFRALIVVSHRYPEESSPALQTILKAKGDRDIRNGKQNILRSLGTERWGIPPNHRLLREVVRAIQEHDEYLNWDDREFQFPDALYWLVASGREGMDGLLALVQTPVSLPNIRNWEARRGHVQPVTRQAALDHAVAADDPYLQSRLAALLQNHPLDHFAPPVAEELRIAIAKAYYQSGNDAAHRNFLKILNSPYGDEVLALALNSGALDYNLGNTNWVPDYARLMDRAGGKKATDWIERHARWNAELLSKHFATFSPRTQKMLIDTWALYTDKAPSLLASKETPAIVKARLRESLKRYEITGLTPEQIITIFHNDRLAGVQQTLLASLRERRQFDLAIGLAKRSELKFEWRREILNGIAQIADPTIDSVLVRDFIQSRPRDAEDARLHQVAELTLRDRAKNPRLRASATLALRQVFSVK